MKFSDFKINEYIMKGIEDAGFTECTQIQAMTLPVSLAGKDVAGQAQTGTGKTAAFLVALFNRLLESETVKKNRSNPRALVLAPTRELVAQIEMDALSLGGYAGLKSVAVYGGVDYQKQRDALKDGVDVLIATPGRFIDYLKQGVFSLKEVEVMVLDEADRMFDLGFIKDIRFIMRRLPPYYKRQTMLFSATLSPRVKELAYEHMNNPEYFYIAPEQVTAEKVKQCIYNVGKKEKMSLLLGLLKKEKWGKTVIFINTKREGEMLASKLKWNGYDNGILTGDIPQKKRLTILDEFKKGKLPILVATDVASRGLHIDGVTHVLNYDLPQDAEDYVHRIGRTARAGAEGKAVSFACENYVFHLEDIEKYIGMKIPLEWAEDELYAEEKEGAPRPNFKSHDPRAKKMLDRREGHARKHQKHKPRPKGKH